MFKNFILSILLFFPLFVFSQQKEEEGGNSQLQRANWEKLITKDPKTGQIPRNELEKSRTEMYRTIQKNKSSRIQSAIPNITWTERGPNDVGGRTRAMLWDPNDSTKRKVWVGGVAGGLWYNNNILDEKSSWQKVNDLWDNIAVGWIAADPSNSKIMYVGTGERGGSGEIGNTGSSGSGGAGVWKSTDAGTTWKRLDSTIPDYTKLSIEASWREIYKIIVNAKGDVFVLNYGGIFRSKDGGITWTPLTGTNAPSNGSPEQVSDMELGSDGILYVAEGFESFSAKILKSTDATVTNFIDITPAGKFDYGRVEIALAPSTKGESQVIYTVSARSSVAKTNFFLKSADAGVTWTPMKVPVYEDLGGGEKPFVGTQGSYDLILGTHDTNPNALYVAGVAYSISVDGGDTWLPKRGYAELGELMHVDNHAFMARPGFPNEAIFGNDGGVYYAADWATSGKNYPKIQKRNRGYNVTQYFSIDINNTANSGTIVVGSQDNGTHSLLSSYGKMSSGTPINGGDGGLTFIDKLDTNIVITSYIHVTPKLHMAGAGKNDSLAVEMQPQFDKRGAFINPADYDSPTHTLYENNTLASEELTKIFRYHIKGVSPKYTYKTSNLTFSGVKALTVSFLKLGKIAGNLYIGTNEGDVYKAKGIPAEGDTTIALVKIMDKESTSSGNVSCLDFGTDENTMVVTKSNYNVKSVFYTTNNGKTWISKDDSLHGLPNVPIRYALINPKSPKQVLLATELGVWSITDITDTTSKWEPNNTTLANVRCDMLKYRATDETIALATHGRGAYTTQINQPCANAVSEEKVTVCSGTTASLIATCATGQVKWFDSTGVKELFVGSPFITSKLTTNIVYKVRCVANGCPIVFTNVAVTIGTGLNVPKADDVTIKTGTSATLTATCASGTPNWYLATTGGSSLGSVTFKTPLLETNTTYYIACESGEQPSCVSSRIPQNVKIGIAGSVGGNLSEQTSHSNVRLSNENTEENLEVVVNVSPNPTTGLLNWKLQSKELTDVNLYLFNAVGKEQMSQNISTFAQTHEGTIDMSRFNSGAFILKFKVGERVITKKVIKN